MMKYLFVKLSGTSESALLFSKAITFEICYLEVTYFFISIADEIEN